MARIELNIVALGNFTSVKDQIAALQVQIDSLAKSTAGIGIGSSLTKELNNANAAFKQTMLSTGQFTMAQVALRTETEKFGQALASGKLGLSDYYNIITQRSSQAMSSMKALAVEQTKLQNSIIISDPTKQGILSVYTPTQIDKVAEATKIATNEANLYAIAVDKGSQSLINWGKNTQWAGRQLTVGLTVPLTIFGQQASQAFLSFDQQMTDMLKVYGAHAQVQSQQTLDAIKKQVTDLADNLARTLGIAMSDTVAISKTFSQMGLEGQDLIKTTDATAKLMKLGGLTADQSAQAAISLQNVFKIQSSQMADAINFLNAAKHSTSTSMQDIIDALPRVGPIMQQLGGTYKDFATLLVGLRENGVPASQSANAIKSMFASLVNPTSKAITDFTNLGISLRGIVQNDANNPLKMIMDLQQGLDKLPSIERTKAIEELFGKFQFARVEALLNSLGKTGSQTQKVLELYGQSSAQLAAVSAQELQIASQGTPAAKYQKAMATIKADLIPIGQKMVEISTTILNFGNTIFNFFNKLPGPVKSVFGAIAIGVALAGPIIMLTGLVANFVGYLIKGIFNIKQLATGGKTLGQLLTPELIAAQNASQVFSRDILDGVTSTDLLNQSIKNLTISIQGMVDALNAGTGIQGVLQTVGAAATTEVAAYEQLHLPGFATGGTVPGSGNYDSYPALLTPGETVIPKSTSKQYAPFIAAMLGGKLPGFATGNSDWEKTIDRGVDTRVNRFRKIGLGLNAGLGKSEYEATGEYDPNKAMTSAWQSLTAERKAVMEFGKQAGLSVEQIKNLLQVQASHIEKDQITVKAEAAGVEKSKVLNVFRGSNLVPDLGAINNYVESVSSNKNKSAFNAWAEATKNDVEKLKQMGLTADEFSKEAGRIASGKHPISEAGLKTISEYGKYDYAKTGNYMGGAAATVAQARNPEFYKNMVGAQGQGIFYQMSQAEEESQVKRVQQAATRLESKLKVSAEAAGIKISTSIKEGLKSGFGIASPSKEGQQIGENVVGSIKMGAEKQLASDKPWWYKQGEQISEEVSNGMNSPASQNNLSSKFSNIFGKLSGSRMGRFGMSGAGLIAAQMASPMISKIPGVGSELSSGMSWASMGMMTGQPEIAALAGAAGFAFTGIQHLIKAEKDHEAAVKSTFTPSADVITMYGGKINQATQAVYNFNTGIKQAAPQLTQTAKDVQAISNAKPSDSLKQIGDLLKGQNTASSVIGTVEQFAAAQVASGMDPSKVNQLVTDLLTYADKTKYLSGALKEITGNTKDLATATSTWLNKLSQAAPQYVAAGESYKNLNSNQKSFADGILQLTNDISSGNLSLSDMQGKLDALSTGAANSTQAINLLSSALANAGQSAAASQVSSWGNLGLNMPSIQLLLAMNKQNMDVNIPTSLQGNASAQADYVKKNLLNQTKLTQLYTSQAKAAAANAKTQLDSTKAAQAQINIQNSGDTTKTKQLQAQKDLIDKQLKTLKDQTSELKAQQQYRQTQADIDSQIKLAQASGDFLKAATLQQQKVSNTTQYASDTRTQQLQNKSDALGQQIATIKDAASQAAQQASVNQQLKTAQANFTAANAAYTAAQKAATPQQIAATVTAVLNLLGLNPAGQIAPRGTGKLPNMNALRTTTTWNPKKKADGGHVTGPGTWTSDSIPAMLSNGEYVISAASVSSYGLSMMNAINNRTFSVPAQNNFATSGTISGATYNVTVNAGSNASAEDIAKTVIDTIKRQTNMTQSNRSVTV